MSTKLKAAAGTDEANVGGTDYKIPPDGIIEVPDDQVDALVERGGFSVVTEDQDTDAAQADQASAEGQPDPAVAAEPVPASDLVPVQHPDHVGCSYRGVSYEPDEAGVVRVPAAAVADLVSHGFEAVEA